MPPTEAVFDVAGFLWTAAEVFLQVAIAYFAGYGTSFIAFRRTDFGKEDKLQDLYENLKVRWPATHIADCVGKPYKEISGFHVENLLVAWSDANRAVQCTKRLRQRLTRAHAVWPRIGFAIVSGLVMGLLIGVGVTEGFFDSPRGMWAAIFALSSIAFLFEVILPQSRDFLYLTRYLQR